MCSVMVLASIMDVADTYTGIEVSTLRHEQSRDVCMLVMRRLHKNGYIPANWHSMLPVCLYDDIAKVRGRGDRDMFPSICRHA